MPTNQEITLLSVLVLVFTYVKAWAFKQWKISQAMLFFTDWLIYLSFIFLLTAALYNMTRVSMRPNSANSPKVIAVHPLDARQ